MERFISTPDRRRFLRSVAGGAATSLLLPQTAQGGLDGPDTPASRKAKAYGMRIRSAEHFRSLPEAVQQPNGDDKLYPDGLNSFTKGLPHDELGRVDKDALAAYMKAVNSGKSTDWAAIPMGGVLRLKNPEAAYSFDMEGLDSHQFVMRPAPTFNSAEQAAEMVELYWQAYLRDVPFAEFDTNTYTRLAASDLSNMTDFRGPKQDGRVTTATLFRGNTPGDLTGPYVSQFLLLPVLHGAIRMEQKIRAAEYHRNYLGEYDTWLDAQRGRLSKTERYDPTPRYIRNGRDLATMVHNDYSYQLYLNAALILMEWGEANSAGILREVRTYAESNPYQRFRTAEGFATFGIPDITDALARVSRQAFQAAWCQKWLVHRRARPEVFGGRIHNHLTGKARYDLHRDILNSEALRTTFRENGNYLLPQAYPEGSPAHPAYPSGHATVAGACVTVLKAYFRESFVVPGPVVATPDGLSLERWSGAPLTVLGELNKLAANVALGRDWAGIHWRTDASEGIQLGEDVALAFLQDRANTYTEDFAGFTLTKFNGTTVSVGKTP